MAKVAKPKSRDVSIHSRAARRGDTAADQSRSARKAEVEETDYKPWLHGAQNAGIGKKKTKHLTRQQRVRQQRGLEKGEINVDKLSKKVADSKSRGKKVNARRVDWDELNDKLLEKEIKNKTTKESGEPRANDSKPMEDVVVETDANPALTSEAVNTEVTQPTASQNVPALVLNGDLDEIT